MGWGSPDRKEEGSPKQAQPCRAFSRAASVWGGGVPQK